MWQPGEQRCSGVGLWPPVGALGRGWRLTAPAAERPLRCTVKTAAMTGFQIQVSKPETFVTAPEKLARFVVGRFCQMRVWKVARFSEKVATL